MGQKTPFVLYTFKDSIISWYQLIGVPQGGDPMPLEEIHIQYGEIHIEYTPTEIEGGGRTDAAIRTGWSVKKNRMV
jgi:type VI protein secretion system component Hcp